MIFLGLGLTPYVSFNIASLALIGYLTLGILVYVRTCIVGEFKISYGKLGPTEIRVLAILLNTSMYIIGLKTLEWTIANYNLTLSIYDLAVLFIAILLFGFFFNTAWKQGRELARLGE
jgi:surface polysaccharide O-acyltransferase-like enzyme